MLLFQLVLSCGKDVVKPSTHGWVLEEEMYPSLSRLSKRTWANVRTVGRWAWMYADAESAPGRILIIIGAYLTTIAVACLFLFAGL